MAKYTRAEIRSILGEAHTDDIENRLIALHLSVVDPLKDQMATYKADAEKLPGLQQRVDELEKAGSAAEVRAEFDAYKQQIEGEKQKAQDDKDIAAIIKEAGVERESFQRLILNSFDRQTLKRGADGTITNRAELVETVKTQNPDCITTTETKGTPPANPPTGGKTGSGMTRAEIMQIKDTTERQRAIAENLDLFGK